MARNEWLGNAQAVAQISTITIANTWAAGDTVTVTINGKSVIVTVGAIVTTAGVAAALKAALAGDALVGDESRNTTGPLIPEFTEFAATVDGSVVTLTGLTAGLGFEFTATETTAGSGTATAATPTPATGPNDVANTANYSLAALPVDGDDWVLSAPVSLLHNLDALDDVTLATLTIPASFWAGGATIGLPRIRGSRASAYNEYRKTALELDGCTAGRIGTDAGGTNNGQTLINIDFKTGDVDLSILQTGTSADATRPAVCLAMLPSNVANAKLEVISGSVGVGFYGETCKCTPKIGYRTNVVGDSKVSFGANVTIGATVDMSGGTVEINSATTAINKTGGELTINGSGAHPIIDNFGGLLVYNSTGTYGATRVNVGPKGSFDLSRDKSAKTQGSTVLMAAGATLIDPDGLAPAFKPVNCQLKDINYVGPFNKTYTAS